MKLSRESEEEYFSQFAVGREVIEDGLSGSSGGRNVDTEGACLSQRNVLEIDPNIGGSIWHEGETGIVHRISDSIDGFEPECTIAGLADKADRGSDVGTSGLRQSELLFR